MAGRMGVHNSFMLHVRCDQGADMMGGLLVSRTERWVAAQRHSRWQALIRILKGWKINSPLSSAEY